MPNHRLAVASVSLLGAVAAFHIGLANQLVLAALLLAVVLAGRLGFAHIRSGLRGWAFWRACSGPLAISVVSSVFLLFNFHQLVGHPA